MNNSGIGMTWTSLYGELKPLYDMNNSKLRMIYMNDSGSNELKPLDAMNSLGLWVIWTILGQEEKPKMLGTTQGCRWHELLKVVSLRL